MWGLIYNLITLIYNLTKFIVFSSIISLYNAWIELSTGFNAFCIFIVWLSEGCTNEYTVENDDGEIIHHFPIINYRE